MSVAVMTANAAPEFRAAGTDLSERRRSGVSQGPLIDIAASGDNAIESTISWGANGAAHIGALATIASIAADARIIAAYPGVAASASGLATPQVRACHTRWQSRTAVALLVFPPSRHRLPEERRQHLPCTLGQSSLRRRLRSRSLRRAASLHDGGGLARL
jgi:xanthine dehydrogenase YagS FAD-binding subunit